MKKIYSLKKIFFLLPLFVLLAITLVSGVLLENDVKVFEGEELVYYIDVYYDGKDVYGIESSDELIASVTSDKIEVEDYLPEGLIFEGFVVPESGDIGSVSRSDGTPCLGYVVNGQDGLHYDEEQHKVSFIVKNLQAGCVLTVGIKTRTPILGEDVERMDFYNTATAVEGLQIATSNTVHAWIGTNASASLPKYKVTYVYEGEIPDNVTMLPTEKEYIEGVKVRVNIDAVAPGYNFSGWTVQSGEVVIENGSFNMPDNDVIFVGSFTKDETFVPYKVTYKLTSTDNPEGYIIPKEKMYYANEIVKIDKLEKGTVFNDYRFSGWTIETENVELDVDNFEMPSNDVVLVGSWEPVTYKVEYKFMGDILPNNSDSLLPETKYYRPGTLVEIENVADVGEYVFMGWYTPGDFEMPSNDVVIYGEWKYKSHLFRPTITKNIVKKKEYYSLGEVVTYSIVVSAPANVDLKDIYVKENNENAKFIAGDNYTLVTDNIVVIDSLPAGASIELKAQYTASLDDNGEVVNEAEIIGALSANPNYELDRTIEYKDTDTFKILSTVEICNIVYNDSKNQAFDYHITGDEYNLWLSLKDGECTKLNLKPGDYQVLEVVPQDYNLTNVMGSITKNNATLNVGLGKEYRILFTNQYDEKGFYHSFGEIMLNIVSFCQNGGQLNGGEQS